MSKEIIRMEPLIHTLIYSHNNKVSLRRLFKRILRDYRMDYSEVAVKVVDHFSIDGSRELMDEYLNKFIDLKVKSSFSVAEHSVDKTTCFKVLLDGVKGNFVLHDLDVI